MSMPTSAVSPADTAQELFDVWHRVWKATADQFGAAGLSMSRAKALLALDAEGPLRARTLADRFGCAAATVTDLVDGLERDGYATRAPDPSDRRAVLISITPTGREAAASARERKHALLDAVFGVLDADEREHLSRLLRRVADSPILTGESL
jgi:DNA-binding MarR family transcriptional regulator